MSSQVVQRTAAPAPAVPEVRVTFTTSTSRSVGSAETPRDVGELTAAGEGAWVLNPKSPLPLTVVGADRSTAARRKELLGSTEYWQLKVPEVALLVAQHNVRFEKLDAFVAQHKRRFDTGLQRRIAGSSEWATASEKDREDLRSEFEQVAGQSLGVFVGRVGLGLLLQGQPPAFGTTMSWSSSSRAMQCCTRSTWRSWDVRNPS